MQKLPNLGNFPLEEPAVEAECQCWLKMLRTFVARVPPYGGSPGMPQRAKTSSRSPRPVTPIVTLAPLRFCFCSREVIITCCFYWRLRQGSNLRPAA